MLYFSDPNRKVEAAKSQTLSLHLKRTLPTVQAGQRDRKQAHTAKDNEGEKKKKREGERGGESRQTSWVTCQLRVETANIFLAKLAET